MRWLILLLAIAGLVALWFFYSPDHWLRKVQFGTVSVDDHRVQADIYFGEPPFSQAEAIALIHVQNVGDYFLDFGNEKVRQASRSEYLRLPSGVWCFKSMRDGKFNNPLPSLNMDEFRVASRNGHVVSIHF